MNAPHAIRIDIKVVGDQLVADVVMAKGPTRLASMMRPPRTSPTRQMFIDLVTTMLGEMIKQVQPGAQVETKIMGDEGNA